jgi:4,5-DOPA dioxygenase extradiol
VDTHLAIGKALASLREEGILILGSGYTFHNLPAFFNPTRASQKASRDFNEWLKDSLLNHTTADALERLRDWDKAPGGRASHPKEEHLLPLFVVAASGGKARLVFEDASDPMQRDQGHAVSGYVFE